MFVRIDYFMKLVEVEALATIKEAKILNFVCKNIVCRFGIPKTIISNNGRHFDSQGFYSFCSNISIKNKFSSSGHPQADGQTEVKNRTLFKIIKAWLKGEKRAWHNKLPSVLWAYQTIARTPTGETLFNLTYYMEAVIFVKIGVTSLRREYFRENGNDDQLKLNLDCLDEVRDKAS